MTPDPIPLLTEPTPLASPSPAAAIVQPVSTPAPIQSPVPTFNIYTTTALRSSTSIPEPGTVIALLLTGAGIVTSVKKRNKQVGQQR
ncbi:MAG: PEP-CTERM sorting domain-containing protein [Oscillatoriales cyanobacterium]|nr:MAG: PEP-CTERM sorting domain-containing protein [Oscillatoriales cyanobacterium]TAE01332.1 MAG: PEP-CTERM sorting domain-containing protein [Oscillatoriales cyanobacterium]TAE02167.1 MAG: PEP-CTERM sorting domain-containing protein [Oscillatoriales cyanobacterium]TAF07032.1 MAG: PEP-CTERM sorting domain-containing protein [Oscillatoriales cyanobacterium]TAF32098.1 MAG: PEP-CTERM sorting domain-containing protein [Oscillatoriales cyanobacterium]